MWIPNSTFALPSPFFLLFLVDVLVQLALVGLLLLSVGSAALRKWLYRLVPRASLRTLLVVLALGLGSTLMLLRARVPTVKDNATRSLKQRIAACQPLSPGRARALGLRDGAVVVDPRPSGAFASGHLVGSCNFSRSEILTSAPLQQLLRDAPGGVLLIHDQGLLPEVFFGKSKRPPGSWHTVRGGLRRYYKPRSSGTGLGWGPAPNLVVDHQGRPVNVQLGPLWFMGRYTSILGLSRHWRRLPPSAVADASRRGVTVVDVRNRPRPATGMVTIPAWNAQLGELDRRAGRAVKQALFLCQNPPSCQAAEALAQQLLRRGGRVHGYVLSRLDGPTLLAQPTLSPASSRWAWPLLLLLLLLASPALALVVTLLGRRLGGWPRLGRALDVAAPLCGVALAALAWPLAARLTAESVGGGWATIHLIDASRFGLDWLAPAQPLLVVALVLLLERRLGRASWPLRLTLLLALYALVVSQVVDQGTGGWHLLGLAAVATTVGGQLAAAWLGAALARRRAGRSALGPRLIPLPCAADVPSAGPKARRLATAHADGIRVPPGLVLLTTIEGTLAAPARSVERRVRRSLGSGLLVVRSSAPEEDTARGLTAGRYLSRHGVRPEEVDEAVRAVLRDYGDKGLPPQAEVAVIIQKQVSGRWAGVALREPAVRGNALQVEASPKHNFDVTSGQGAQRRDHVGAVSRSWLTGAFTSRELSAPNLLDLFERLEHRLQGPAQIEWSCDAHGLVLLQVRPAPEESRQEGVAADPTRVWEILRPGLRWLRGRPNALVLDAGGLSDFHHGTSHATRELLQRLWEGAVRREALGLLGLPKFAAPARPVLAHLEGALYENRVVNAPLRLVLTSPVERVATLLLRLRLGSRLDTLEQQLSDLEQSLPEPSRRAGLSPDAAAERVLRVRDELLTGPGPQAVAIGILTRLLTARRRWRRRLGRVDGDPFMQALAQGRSPRELADRHPLRALPDLALERPRLGEQANPQESPPSASGAPAPETAPADHPVTPATRLDRLRGRARVVMAHHAARLRFAYLDFGQALERDDVFTWTTEELTRLAAGEKPPPTRSTEPTPDNVPVSVRLPALEAWVAQGVPATVAAGAAKLRGVWIGEPRPILGIVVSATHLTPEDVSGAVPVLLLDSPQVEEVMEAPDDFVLLAAGGSALCHAAMIARQRGVAALFGVGDEVRTLQVGDRVRLTASGRVLPEP